MHGLNFCSSVFMFSPSVVLYLLAKLMRSIAAACQKCQVVRSDAEWVTIHRPGTEELRGQQKQRQGEAASCLKTRAVLFSLLFAHPGSPGVSYNQTKPRAWERCWQTFTAIVRSNKKWPASVCHKPVWFFEAPCLLFQHIAYLTSTYLPSSCISNCFQSLCVQKLSNSCSEFVTSSSL